jgi:hypothetical protein
VTAPDAAQARARAAGWIALGDRGYRLELGDVGAEWVEVKRSRPGTSEGWRVEGRLCAKHYKLADAFATQEIAQGCAILLAMRLLPAWRDALRAAIDAVPGAWWWKISPADGETAEHRAILSSRTSDSAAEAERSGRAAGAGWWLYVYGPGAVQAFGRLPG